MILFIQRKEYTANEMKSFFFLFTLNGLKIKNFVTKDFLRQKLMILKNQQTKKSVVYGLSQCAYKILNKIVDPFNKTIAGEGA